MRIFAKPRKILLFLILISIASTSFYHSHSLLAARNDEGKLDPVLRQLYRQELTGRKNQASEISEQSASRMRKNPRDGSIGVIVKLRDDSEAALQEVEGNDLHLRARIGNIAVADIRPADLPRIAAISAIHSLHVARPKEILADKNYVINNYPKAFINDAANTAIKAPEARSVFNVTGRGVAVGVVDTGIDWWHPDFRTADGKTRIKALWDLSDPAGTGPNGVGRVFTEAEINSALQRGETSGEHDYNGHGSMVAGTAVGNGLGTSGTIPVGTFAGIAPEADLIVVKATRGITASFYDDDLIAAMSFIRDQAAAINEPFVINLSIGGHYSSHDGTDPLEIAIDNLIASGNGRQVVVAAGNEGNDGIHAGGILAESVYSIIPFTITEKAEGLIAIYSGADTINARLIKPNGAVVGPVSLYDLITGDPDVELENAIGETSTSPKAILVTFKRKPAGQWKLMLMGTTINNGRYDIWTQDAGETHLDASVRDGLSSVASPATSRRAISVGNFVTKTEYFDQTGTLQTRTQQGTIGQLAISSSLGPSRDGRLTPLLTAPGTYIASTRSADYTVDSLTGNSIPAQFLTNDNGKHYVSFGSSFSAASVTGTVALMLQANRNLSPDQIRRLLIQTVSTDNFTGASVSPQFGYGKLNAMEAVKAAAASSSITDFVSVSGASYLPEAVAAPEMIMAGFGSNLASVTAAAPSLPLPTTLGDVSVRLTDSTGMLTLAPLFYVSPYQINYQIPPSIHPGMAKIEIVKPDNSVVARGCLSLNNAWPGLFSATANGSGIAAGEILRITANGDRVYEPLSNFINLSNAGEKVYLQLYGTGLRGRSNLNNIKLTLGGTPLTVEYTGPQNYFAGLDQINAVVPPSLAGRNRTLDLILYLDGWAANIVKCKVQ